MKESIKSALAFILPMSLAFICFGISFSVMNGYENCWHTDTFHGTYMARNVPNCANDKTLMTHDVFFVLGIIFILAQVSIVSIISWRKEEAEEINIESIKISEL